MLCSRRFCWCLYSWYLSPAWSSGRSYWFCLRRVQ
nr:MAG TPA: hypothetical protein [Crassvirales sp.]